MTRQEQLNLIRRKCIEANPFIETRRIDCVDEDTWDDMWVLDSTIRLADVLSAIAPSDDGGFMMGANGYMRCCPNQDFNNSRANSLTGTSAKTTSRNKA